MINFVLKADKKNLINMIYIIDTSLKKYILKITYNDYT